MIALVYALTVMVGAATVALFWMARRLRAAKDEGLRAAQELQLALDLVGAVSRAEWRRSAYQMVHVLAERGLVRSAALLSGTDPANMEVLASAVSHCEIGWDHPDEEAIAQLLRTGEAQVSGADRYIPVVADSGTVGVLAVRGESPEHGPALGIAARLAGLVMVGTKLYQKQATISNTDGLTGLINHRYFQQMLGITLGQAYLESAPLSIIFIDIDHFKQINDTYGHQFGDLVLREIGSLLRRELPADAIPARYGGEEMIVLVSGESARRATQIAEQLRQAIANHRLVEPVSGTKIGVTVSLGVADYELGQGKSRLIARADEALYTSKRMGRNRVTVAALESVTLSPSVS